MTWKQKILQRLRKCGIDINRFTPEFNALARRMALMKRYGVELVIDVGAHAGGYGRELRAHGYGRNIVSFEPITDIFARLESVSQGDEHWDIWNAALGSKTEKQMIHVSGKSASSSILEMSEKHKKAAPGTEAIRDEEIQVYALDAILGELSEPTQEIWLKIDTQGYEMEVLKGAGNTLSQIKTIQVEMSFVQLYKGGVSFENLLEFMKNRNYRIVSIESGFTDSGTGEMLQADFIFRLCE